MRIEIEQPSHEKIKACADEQTLARWYSEHEDLSTSIRDETTTARECLGDHVDKQWLRKASDKTIHLVRSMRVIERRMLDLGFTPPYPPRNPQAREISKLLGANGRLKGVINRLRAFAAEHGLTLPDDLAPTPAVPA